MKFLTIGLILVGLVVAVYLAQQNTNILPKADAPSVYQSPTETIEDNEDLMRAAGELNDEDLDSLNEELNQNDQDLKSF